MHRACVHTLSLNIWMPWQSRWATAQHPTSVYLISWISIHSLKKRSQPIRGESRASSLLIGWFICCYYSSREETGREDVKLHWKIYFPMNIKPLNTTPETCYKKGLMIISHWLELICNRVIPASYLSESLEVIRSSLCLRVVQSMVVAQCTHSL